MAYILQRIVGRELRRTQLSGPTLGIGRGTNAQLRFEDAAVALEHAVVEMVGEEYVLQDRGSITGTYVNGRRVDRVRLAEGDEIEIGGHRVRVNFSVPAGVLVLTVDETAAPMAATLEATGPVKAPTVDYVAAYRLERPYLTRGFLGLAAAGAAVLIVSLFPLTGRTTVFRPGPVSQGHGRLIQAMECSACHRPWRGPSDALCQECHQQTVHQAEEPFTPSCVQCHVEHRDLPRLTVVDDRQCVVCHRQLTLQGGGEPRFARRITAFVRDHPEFGVSVAGPEGSQRTPMTEPAARRADPTPLAFNHRVHLAPDLPGPQGRVQLACGDCHRLAEGGASTLPVSFEAHCQSCHGLTFDDRLPPAPHGAADLAYAFLVTAYTARPQELAALSPEEMRSRIFRRGAQTLRLEKRIERLVFTAADQLFRNKCQRCHEMNFDAWPPRPPGVQPPAIPETWFVHARFSHWRHRGVDCASCHQGVETSRETADLLLPGIATCQPCHGGTAAAERRGEAASTACVTCHDYHGREGVSSAAMQISQAGR